MVFKKRKALCQLSENVEKVQENQSSPSFGRKNKTLEEKQIVATALKYFEGYKKGDIVEIPRKQVITNVSKVCGVSESTVRRVKQSVKQSDSTESTAPKTSVGRPNIHISSFHQDCIRQTVHDFYVKKTYPTVADVLQKLRENVPDFPEISQTTLLRCMHSMKFEFKKFNSRSVCFQAQRIVDQRTTFFRLEQKYSDHGYKFYYTDETWSGANQALTYGWQEDVSDLNPNRLDFDRSKIQEINGWKGGLIKPSGAGKRTIILDIGSEDGFLEPRDEISMCFESKKDSSDYHNEMNGDHYCEWFERVLLHIPNKSVIVIDRAPYHTVQDPSTRNPAMNWKKCDIIEWLVQNHVEPEVDDEGVQSTYEELTKTELIELGRPKFKPFKYKLETLILKNEKNVKLLWLPVAHCELNPIEIIWSHVKRGVAKENATFKQKDVLELCRRKLREVTKEQWQGAIRHSQGLMVKYRERDQVLNMEEVIINFVIRYEIPDLKKITLSIKLFYFKKLHKSKNLNLQVL